MNLKEYRTKILFPYVEAGRQLAVVSLKTTLSGGGDTVLTYQVESNVHLFSEYIATQSTGTFDISEISINQRKALYGNALTNQVLTQYNAFPLQFNAFIPARSTIQIRVKDTSGAANTITIMLKGFTIPV
jgi:hypothetical protein